MNTIYILWLRQLKRYVRSKARMIGSLGQPILFMVAFGFGFGPIYQKAGGGNYLDFIAPGIIAMGILFTGVFMGIELIWDRQFGFLKETLVAPVSRVHIMIGRTLGGATVATIQGIIVFLMSLVVGFRPAHWITLPVAFVFMFLIALLFTALGTAIASRMEDMHGFQLIINFLIMPIFFLSGSLFPLANLPKPMAIISQIDPLSYGIDGLRATMTNGSHFGLMTDFLVLNVLIFLLFIVGGWLFERIEI